MKNKDTNSIRYPAEVDEKLEKLSQGLKRSKKEIFCQMVDYFYRSKKDPADLEDEILKKQLSSGISRIISFIRQQEKDFILPLFTESILLKNTFAKQSHLLEAIGKHLMAESEKTQVLGQQTGYLVMEIKTIHSKQKQKQLLKQQFSEILEYYITQREEMAWTSSALKREKLISHVRKSVQHL